MIRRTPLLVAVLTAAALAFVPSASADVIPEVVEIPPLVPTAESIVPPLNANVHADTQVDLAPIVRVDGSASVDVDPEGATVPVQDDGAEDKGRVATDVDAAGSVAPAAAATSAIGLLALLAFGIEAVRTAAANAWSHVVRAARGTARFALLLPLFSRIRRADLLDNPVRASIHAAVAENPGLSLTEVKSRTGIAWGTAVHHLQRLENHGMVVSATERGHRRYFVAGSPAAMRRNDIAVMAHPTARRIATLVNGHPGIDQTGICQTLGLNNPAASKHLRGFEAQGLVLAQRSGRQRVYRSTPSMDAALPFVQGMRIEFAAATQKHVGSVAPVVTSG